MNEAEVLAYARCILREAKVHDAEDLEARDFREFAHTAAQAARSLKQPEKFGDLRLWAKDLRRLVDTYDIALQRDPMLQYRPKHKVALEFHSSIASVRWFESGNRCSKTQSGYAEDYFVATGQHRWRSMPRGNVFIVALTYSQYAPNVFEKKMLQGETDNILSPMFPEGGKWLHHYDARRHMLVIACPECAHAGRAQQCNHEMTSITLFSGEGSWEVIQGAQYRLGHFDEHVPEGFYDEAQQRLAAVQHSGLIVTGTPLFGLDTWEQKRLGHLIKRPALNHTNALDPTSPPIVTRHHIDQFAAGIVPHEKIRELMAGMDEFAIKARVYGLPSPDAKNPVFDRYLLAAMMKKATAPKLCTLATKGAMPLDEVKDQSEIELHYAEGGEDWTGLRIWEPPLPNGQYIVGVDTAKGLTRGDASCATVLKMTQHGGRLRLSVVAQFHGWLNIFDYAEEVFKLAVLYNSATVVVELTGGFGEGVVLKLKELCYWNLYRDAASPAHAEFSQDARFGVDTNASTKPFMVAALQQFVKDGLMDIPDKDTLEEMLAFTQENTGKGGMVFVTPRYRGGGGARDDRVLSLCIGCSVAVTTMVFDYTRAPVLESSQPMTPEWKAIYQELTVQDPSELVDTGAT